MLSVQEINAQLQRNLLSVQKPGRYVGGEYNQTLKNWDQISTHVALVFPDIYDIGLPNLGLAILYDLINQREDCLAERAYAPWLDMEVMMREKGIPLYALESKHPLAAFDILGITLPYETLYTNALNLLDLAQIPLLTSERDESHPLVVAGGHSTFNPEPMSDFIDAFVIGEGEEVMLEIVDCYQAWKLSGAPRSRLLLDLARLKGLYVPSLYTVEYHPDGKVKSVQPNVESAPKPILKRIVAKLPPPVTRFLVPTVEIVHNRVSIEIMRGCTRGCRFCQAGMINRPVRERPVEEVLDAIEAAVDQTGFEEVGLLSLSSSDYTHVVDLVQQAGERFAGRQLTIAVPSLRIESFSAELMDQLKNHRPGGGFTLAPEAASERMRKIINKPVTSAQLIETARTVFEHGWTTLKLYFMIGHPSETLEDVQAIADLCKAVMAEGRKIIGGKAHLHAGVATFVPKPHTPFQWVSSDGVDSVRAKQDLLKRELRDRNIKLSWTRPEDTLLEAWLSRGDRRTGKVILHAWQLGAKFDAWQDQYQYALWQQAYADCGIDPMFYSHRTREDDEVFPWDHISIGVRRSYLLDEYHRSQAGELRGDCRLECYACGILPAFNPIRAANPGPGWKCPEVTPHAARLSGAAAEEA